MGRSGWTMEQTREPIGDELTEDNGGLRWKGRSLAMIFPQPFAIHWVKAASKAYSGDLKE